MLLSVSFNKINIYWQYIFEVMTYLILFAIALGSLWARRQTQEEVFRIALASTSFLSIFWGYLSSPSLIQCLGLVVATGICQLSLTTKC